MARSKGRRGSPTNLYIDNKLKRDASRFAFKRNLSLSELVNELLKREMASASATVEAVA